MEGQLLVDEVLEHFHYTGPVQRIWLASLDSRSIQKALSTLKDNSNYANLRDAAHAHSQADWLIAMNASRAMTIFGQETGHTDGVLSLGRVQTPTLALVVQRDREIAAFTPIDYLVLQATLQHDAGTFSAIFKPSETQPGLDSEGRLVDGATAQDIMDAVRGKNGTITSVTHPAAQDIYTVRDENGAETLFPAVKPFLKQVDLENGRVLVEPIPGMFTEAENGDRP